MSALQKPELRGHLKRNIIRAIGGAFTTGGIACSLLYFFYYVPRQKAYEDFHRTYDPKAHIKLLNEYGYLESSVK